MTVLIRLIEHQTRIARTFELYESELIIHRGHLVAFVLHADQGLSELFVLSSPQRAHLKPALIQAAAAQLNIRLGFYLGERWGVRGAAIGGLLTLLARELARIYGTERANYYADSHGRIRFLAPAEVLL